MLLLEIASQGVKAALPASGSVRLRSGYNVLAADGAALRRLLEALLYPGDRGEEGLAPSGGARAGLTLLGDDGGTYRLLHEFGGGRQLHRLDPAKRAFVLVCDDPAAVARQLAEVVGVPPLRRLGLLSLSAAELPSHRAASLTSASVFSQRRPLDPTEARGRLGELRHELEQARRAEKLQFRFDEVQGRLFKVEEALKTRRELSEALAAAESALAARGAAGEAAERLGDVEAALAAYGGAVARRDEALARIEAEERATAEAEGVPLRPFWRDPRFWGGVGAGGAAILVALAGEGQGARRFALLDIPAFGWAAWVALRWVAGLEARGRGERRRRLAEEHRAKVAETFERESGAVRQLMGAAGVATIAELRDALARLSDERVAVAGARQRLEAFEARPETRAAEAEKVRVEEEIRATEQELMAVAGGYVRDPRSVEMEIQRVSAEAEAEAVPAPEPAAEQAQSADPVRELLEGAAAELGGGVVGVALTAQFRASAILQAMSAGRLAGVGADDRANLTVMTGGKPAAMATLAPADRDLVFLALKLAFAEQLMAKGRATGLVDDALSILPEAGRRAAARILKQLARTGQVLHSTPDPAFREAADHLA